MKYFVDAAVTQNFSKVAKRFYVPPSAVSQSIKRLENELGVTLFSRQANKVTLNENGAVFFEKIQAALELIDGAKKSVTERNGARKIRLSIYINRRIVMQTVEKFNREYPNVDIVTKYLTSPDSEQVDLVISDAPGWKAELSREVLLSEDIVLAMHKDNPLAKQADIAPEALAGEAFISTNEGSSLYAITQAVCESMGFTPRIVLKSDDPYYIRKCIESGLGIACVPSVSWHGQFSDRVVLRKISGHQRTTYVYKSKEGCAQEHIRDFLALLFEECKRELASFLDEADEQGAFQRIATAGCAEKMR